MPKHHTHHQTWMMPLDGFKKKKQFELVTLYTTLCRSKTAWDFVGSESTYSRWKIPGYAALSPKTGYIIRLERQSFIYDLHDGIEPTEEQRDWWHVVAKDKATQAELNGMPARRGRQEAGIFYSYEYAENLAWVCSIRRTWEKERFVRVKLLREFDGAILKEWKSE